MQDHNHVKVRFECRRLGSTVNACVHVDRTVPGKLRCTPTGGGGAGFPQLCSDCRRYLDPDELRRAVQGLREATGDTISKPAPWFSAANGGR